MDSTSRPRPGRGHRAAARALRRAGLRLRHAPAELPAAAVAGERRAQRRVRARARRADLPDLGAHVRVQPRVRALPVVVGAARPARALDRRVQGRDRRARAHAGLLREHRRRRADGAQGLLGARRVRDRAPRRREVLHQRRRGSTPSGRRGCAASDYVDVQISLGRRDGGGQRPRARRGLLRDGDAGDVSCSPARAPSSASSSRARTPASSTSSRRSRTSSGDAAAHAAAAVGPRRRRVGRAASHAGAAARRLRLAARARRGRAHRRLVLPPRRATAQTLPGLNLCGAGRVVCLIDPIGDVYACPFAIHETFLAGNVREAGFAPRVARVGAVPSSCASRRRRARAGRAACTTPAAAAAWRRSSSPGCRSTGPIPECVFGHGERALRGDAAEAVAGSLEASRSSRRACDESPV